MESVSAYRVGQLSEEELKSFTIMIFKTFVKICDRSTIKGVDSFHIYDYYELCHSHLEHGSNRMDAFRI